MKERPILFSGPMVRALLAGRKTQTRRVVNRLQKFGKITEFGKSDTPGYDWIFRNLRMLWNDLRHARLMGVCPYGQPGDRLWVRETFLDGLAVGGYAPGVDPDKNPGGKTVDVIYRADDGQTERSAGPWKPCIFMPRWASRITLEITDVRVQRLQDISAEDALAEGVVKVKEACHVIRGFDYDKIWLCHTDPVTPFYKLWDSINEASGYGWEANPWVWAITFRRL